MCTSESLLSATLHAAITRANDALMTLLPHSTLFLSSASSLGLELVE